MNGKKSECCTGFSFRTAVICNLHKLLRSRNNSDISKFPDDTKIARPVRNIEDTRWLQEDIDR